MFFQSFVWLRWMLSLVNSRNMLSQRFQVIIKYFLFIETAMGVKVNAQENPDHPYTKALKT